MQSIPNKSLDADRDRGGHEAKSLSVKPTELNELTISRNDMSPCDVRIKSDLFVPKQSLFKSSILDRLTPSQLIISDRIKLKVQLGLVELARMSFQSFELQQKKLTAGGIFTLGSDQVSNTVMTIGDDVGVPNRLAVEQSLIEKMAARDALGRKKPTRDAFGLFTSRDAAPFVPGRKRNNLAHVKGTVVAHSESSTEVESEAEEATSFRQRKHSSDNEYEPSVDDTCSVDAELTE